MVKVVRGPLWQVRDLVTESGRFMSEECSRVIAMDTRL